MSSMQKNTHSIVTAILLLIFLTSFSPLQSYSGPTSTLLVGTKNPAIINKEKPRLQKKYERKIEKLKKKIARINAGTEEGSKGLALLIAGGVMMLVGIIMMLTSGRRGSTLDGAAAGCLQLLAGTAISIAGLVLLIVGLVI